MKKGSSYTTKNMEKVPTIKKEEDETDYCYYSSIIEVIEDYTNIDCSNDTKPHHIENSYNCRLKAQDYSKKKAKRNKHSTTKNMEKVSTIKKEEDETDCCYYSSMIEVVEDYTYIDYSNDMKPHHVENLYSHNLKTHDCPEENIKKKKYSDIKTNNETTIKVNLDEDESIKPIEEVIIKEDTKDDISKLCFEPDKKNDNKIVEIEIMKYNEYGLSTVIERISNDYVEEIVILGLQDIQDYTNKTSPISFQKSYNSSTTSTQNAAHGKVSKKPYSINRPSNELIWPIETNGNNQKESVKNHQISTKPTNKVLDQMQLFNTKPDNFEKSFDSSSSTSAQNVARDKVNENPLRNNDPSNELILPIEETNKNNQNKSVENHQIPTKSTVKVSNEAQSFICNMCQKSFNSKKQIIRHFEVSHNRYPVVKSTLQKRIQYLPKSKDPNRKTEKIKRKNGRLFHECAFCSKSFTAKSNLVLHERVHTGEKPYTCGLCLKSFSTKANQVRHERMHSSENAKAYKCDICSKGFSTRHGLILHKRLHTGEKPYTCSICSKSFTVKSSLVIHERVHTGVQPYSCGLCSKSFSNKLLLMQHEHVHTGIKLHQCDVCSRSFTSKQYLGTHKLRHAGKYQYKCDICSMPVWSKTHLVQHRRVHTGEKPYKCDLCLKVFSFNKSLVIHKRVHTGEALQVRPLL